MPLPAQYFSGKHGLNKEMELHAPQQRIAIMVTDSALWCVCVCVCLRLSFHNWQSGS